MPSRGRVDETRPGAQGEYVADDEHNQDLPEVPSLWAPPPADDLPERLRVHSLARVLGTTSKRVRDALMAIDGRSRSVHSSVGQAEAIRVREILAADDGAVAVTGGSVTLSPIRRGVTWPRARSRRRHGLREVRAVTADD